MQTETRIAIVGAGYMAQEHAKAFASLPGVRIAGIVSRTRKRAETLAAGHGAIVYDNIDAMARDAGAHAVVVAVPEMSMQSVCESVMIHPWVSLLEKPVGLDLPQAEAITRGFAAAGRRAFVALNRRAHASTRQALDELAGDGSPRLVSVLDQQDQATARALGHPEPVVQCWMYANSIHLVDYFHVFCRGELQAVEVLAPWDPANPRRVVAGLRFDSGDCGIYQAVWDGPGPWAVSVTNPQVRLELRPLERLGIQRRGERRLTDIPADPIDSDFKPGLRWQAEQLLHALAGRDHGLATLAEATRSMALVARIYGHAAPIR